MKIVLQKSFFNEKEKELLTYGNFKVNSFLYKSGVEALRVTNSKMTFIFTPYKGQQIWHPTVNGIDFSMETTIKEPTSSSSFFETYGGFLYHCGLNQVGGAEGNLPHHGELPNIMYDVAYLQCGHDENGKYIILGGELDRNVSFDRHFRFVPEIKLYEDGTVFNIKVKIDNLRSDPLEYMYLCHMNFRPFNGAKIIYSGKCDSENVVHYKSPTDDMEPEIAEKYNKFYELMEKNPEIINEVGNEDEFYKIGICFGLNYMCDENNRAYTLQCTKDGACYVSHPTNILTNGVRWVSRTENDDAMGMILPATSEHIGYAHAKSTGQLKTIKGNSSLEFTLEAGWLEPNEAEIIKQKIKEIVK